MYADGFQGAASTNKGNLQRKLEQIQWVEEEIGEVTASIQTKETVRVQLTGEVARFVLKLAARTVAGRKNAPGQAALVLH